MLVPREACHDVAQGQRPEQADGRVVGNEARDPTIDAAEFLFRFVDLGANPVA
jgi:hypothetical protein